MPGLSLSQDQSKALEEILNDKWDTDCYLVWGAAGTGKSTLVRELAKAKPGKVLVCAFTGIAAENVGGTTIHRLIGIGIHPLPYRDNSQIPLLDADRREVLRKAELIVVDEISMVRVDLMDALDWSLRRNLNQEDKPFGGKKVVLVGDLLQLGPVVTQDDRHVLALWEGHMFFNAKVWDEAELNSLPLIQVHRQTEDPKFAECLGKLRAEGGVTEAVEWLGQHLKVTVEDDNKVVLCPKNSDASQINEQRLRQLPGDPKIYQAYVQGDFKDKRTLEQLHLKVGARVVVVANDSEASRRYVNGTVGRVTRLMEGQVEIEKEDGGRIALAPHTWKEFEPRVNDETGLIEYVAVAKFTQIPLKLAWAITIHKSQGLSLNAAHLVPSTGFFASGHAYVALSRVRSIKGLTSDRRLGPGDFYWDPSLRDYLQQLESEVPSLNS